MLYLLYRYEPVLTRKMDDFDLDFFYFAADKGVNKTIKDFIPYNTGGGTVPANNHQTEGCHVRAGVLDVFSVHTSLCSFMESRELHRQR